MRNLQDISVQYIKGVGPARKELFNNLGIESVEDLLYFFPRRYEDRRKMTPLSKLKIGEWQTISGKVLARGARKSWFTKKYVFEVVIGDANDRVFAVWFNQPYLEQYFRVGLQIILYGKVDLYKNRIQLVSPEYEIITGDDVSLSMERIVPIYTLTRGLSQRYLRKVIKHCIDHYEGYLKDILPVRLRNKHRFSNIRRSIGNIHFPDNFDAQESAFRRISFEEFFLFQLSVITRRLSIIQKKGISQPIRDSLKERFFQTFPFPLTGAQKKVIQEISLDMQKNMPMLRLLQGDVGSGKTLVAFWGCVVAFENGYQSALMAPTEILAQQHFQTLQKIIQDGPFKEMRIAFLSSSLKKREKEQLYGQTKEGEIDLLIGTHALLQEDLAFKNLSFVIIDEQHKFGVRQRALLSKKGFNPDVLIMTATPIPRTLSLTLYGDLDVSIIDELPPNRGVITTKLFSEDQSQQVYTLVREFVKKGRQAFIVYPIVEESEKMDLKAAEAMVERFKNKEFKDFSVGLVHGQMKREEADRIMGAFKNHQVDILVATTVLEVGVDVPNATLMVIEHAQRFGLAQLHQLRGRVGRGQQDGLCILVGDPTTVEGGARLDAILASNDGFKIAEQDLMIRGPGHYLGRHQHGLGELKVANPATQIDILELARKEAIELIQEDPNLHKGPHAVLRKIIHKRYPAYLSTAAAG